LKYQRDQYLLRRSFACEPVIAEVRIMRHILLSDLPIVFDLGPGLVFATGFSIERASASLGTNI
jgi:hypothetical protein